ncbi:hypothetical protein AAFN89_00155 [Inquilinus sp. CAU 1745]
MIPQPVWIVKGDARRKIGESFKKERDYRRSYDNENASHYYDSPSKPA